MSLADEGGIGALTMRSLGRALGVEAMSLYNHVANKDAVLDGIVGLVLAEFQLPPAGEDWDVAIRKCAVSAHEALLRHPWACPLVMELTSGPAARAARMRYIDALLGRLHEAGFSPELRYHAYHALDSHVLGFTLWQIGHKFASQGGGLVTELVRELSSGGYPHLAEHAGHHAEFGDDQGFEFGLDLVLDGLKTALAPSAPGQGRAGANDDPSRPGRRRPRASPHRPAEPLSAGPRPTESR
jgi:AcrR family transcriptional regulator